MINNDNSLDPVSRYLRLQGYAMRPAYFYQTGCQIGWEINTRAFSMTYQLQHDVLLICQINTSQLTQGLASGLMPLIKLWRAIHEQVDEVRQIRGMIQSTGTARDKILRKKMAEVLTQQGAHLETKDGQSWLVFP